MKTWTERIGIVVAAGALSMMLNAPPSRTQQLSPVAGGVPTGGIIFQTGACWEGWAEYTPARGRYVVGLVGGGTEAGTVGAALGDRESRATGAHSHGSGALSASYTRPGVSYTRPTVTYQQPTASYTWPRVNYKQPTASLDLPKVTYTPQEVTYTPQEVTYTPQEVTYTWPTVSHHHTHIYESMGPTTPVDGGNDAAGRAIIGEDPNRTTTGPSDVPRVSGGRISLSDGVVSLSDGVVSLSGGGVSLSGGSVGLSGGGVSLDGGGVGLSGGGVGLSGGGVSLSGGSVGLSGATGSAGRGVAAPYIQLRACRKL